MRIQISKNTGSLRIRNTAKSTQPTKPKSTKKYFQAANDAVWERRPQKSKLSRIIYTTGGPVVQTFAAFRSDGLDSNPVPFTFLLHSVQLTTFRCSKGLTAGWH